MQQLKQAWAGIDAGKDHHHVVVIDSEGRRLLSRRVLNGESELIEIIDAALARAATVSWAIDLADGPAALIITLLLERGQRLVFLPGIAVNRASGAYRGEGKTDAKDRAVIADQARMRRDLRELHLEEEMIAELRMLTAQRNDLAADRARTINRLRQRLLGVFPALERALDFTNQGPLVLISQFQTPHAIRAVGPEGSNHGFAAARSERSASSLQQPSRPPTHNIPASAASPWPRRWSPTLSATCSNSTGRSPPSTNSSQAASGRIDTPRSSPA